MTEVKFDYSKLRGRIREKLGTEKKLADELGLTPVSLSSRLNNKIGFSNTEINTICDILEISKQDASSYFLCTRS